MNQVYRSILITGGRGMLARAVAGALEKRGLRFTAAGHAECDISDRAQIAGVFARLKPTLVINCAAHTGVDACEDQVEKAFALNATGPGLLAEACREHGARLVHYSTDFVFNGESERPYRPTDSTDPLSVYGRSKLEGEKQVLDRLGERALLIRTAWLFGSGGHNFPKTIAHLARAGKPLRVVDDQWGAPTHTVDLAEATLALLECESGGIFHVTNSGKTSWFHFAGEVVSRLGLVCDLQPVSTEQWLQMRPKQAKRPRFSVMDLSRYTQTTGRTPRDWHDALADWVKAEPG